MKNETPPETRCLGRIAYETAGKKSDAATSTLVLGWEWNCLSSPDKAVWSSVALAIVDASSPERPVKIEAGLELSKAEQVVIACDTLRARAQAYNEGYLAGVEALANSILEGK